MLKSKKKIKKTQPNKPPAPLFCQSDFRHFKSISICLSECVLQLATGKSNTENTNLCRGLWMTSTRFTILTQGDLWLWQSSSVFTCRATCDLYNVSLKHMLTGPWSAVQHTIKGWIDSRQIPKRTAPELWNCDTCSFRAWPQTKSHCDVKAQPIAWDKASQTQFCCCTKRERTQ